MVLLISGGDRTPIPCAPPFSAGSELLWLFPEAAWAVLCQEAALELEEPQGEVSAP